MALVLVVDDSDTDRLYTRTILKAKGYDVIEALNGAEALVQVKQRPQAILLDVVMPIMDGFETLRALQADADAAYIPTLLMTSRDSSEDAVEGLRLGAHDFLQKPVDPTELEARVGAACRVATLYAQLRTRNEDLEMFARHAAHDIKSPLTVIRGYVQMLAGEWGPMTDDRRSDAAEKATLAVERTINLVSDTLALARQGTDAEAGAIADPAIVVKAVLDAAELQNTDIDVEGEWEPVAISPSALEAIVRNLIENASHYGRSDDGRLRLRIDSARVGPRVTIRLEDHGPGIDPSDADRIFEPFQRGDDAFSANPRSTGVGLAIVRRAAERWGGSVSLERGEAGGARFVVAIPAPPNLG